MVKKILILLCFGWGSNGSAFAQPSVIESAGGVTQVGNLIIAYAIGQPAIHTGTTGSNWVTGGFEQPEFIGARVSTIHWDDKNLRFDLAPNPANNQLTVNITGEIPANWALTVVDVIGRVVQKHPLSMGTEKLQINTSDLANGMYLVRVVSDNQVLTHLKFFVQH